MAATAKTTFIKLGPEGLQFHYLWPGSPTVPEAKHKVSWDEVGAITISKRTFAGRIVHRDITFYLEDGWYEVSDKPWVEGWEQVVSNLRLYLPLSLPEWRDMWETIRPEDKPILIFQRGPELPASLQDECDQHTGHLGMDA